ncbi:MAG: ABC transporter permease [Candidatus Hadarchaeum sp.]|uniref:ABC transporter permease n=1 Tax=Candidatus Hadarchaeum sp. TaxID=2883567 RepID=UPI00317A5E24
MSIEKYIGRFETLFAIAIAFIVAIFISPVFLSSRNLVNIFMHISIIGIIATTMTFVISMGGIDLSVGSVLALSSICATVLLKNHIPVIASIVIGLLVGATVGGINGILTVFAKLPPFIVTLGTMGIARGAALIIAGGRSVYGFPSPFLAIGQSFVGNIIPVPVIIFMSIVLISYFIYFYTPFGKYTVIIGDNEEAAYSVGIPVKKIKVVNYIISGISAAIGGIIFAARLNAAEPTSGIGYELDAIAAVVIGGTHLFGGRGTVLGTFLGIVFVGLIRNILNLLAVSPYFQQIAIGSVLIGAVLLDNLRAQRVAD